jgi:hypothetical protein
MFQNEKPKAPRPHCVVLDCENDSCCVVWGSPMCMPCSAAWMECAKQLPGKPPLRHGDLAGLEKRHVEERRELQQLTNAFVRGLVKPKRLEESPIPERSVEAAAESRAPAHNPQSVKSPRTSSEPRTRLESEGEQEAVL